MKEPNKEHPFREIIAFGKRLSEEINCTGDIPCSMHFKAWLDRHEGKCKIDLKTRLMLDCVVRYFTEGGVSNGIMFELKRVLLAEDL